MRNLLLLPVFLLIAANAKTQENTRTVSLKIYAGLENRGLEYEKSARQQTIISGQQGYSIGHFSPAVNISNTKFNHEIELSRLVIGRTDDIRLIDNMDNNLPIPVDGERKTAIDVSIRYELNYGFKSGSRRLLPQIGIGFQPYFQYSQITPKTSGVVPLTRTLAGNRVYVVPRIVFKTRKRLFFDLNLPLTLLDSYYLWEKEQNPLLSTQEMKTYLSGSSFFENWFQLRIGAGIQL